MRCVRPKATAPSASNDRRQPHATRASTPAAARARWRLLNTVRGHAAKRRLGCALHVVECQAGEPSQPAADFDAPSSAGCCAKAGDGRQHNDRQRRSRRAPRTGHAALIMATPRSATAPLSPPRGTTTSRSKYLVRKFRSTGSDESKKLSMSASSSGSTRRTCGPGRSPAIENCPSRVNVKLPTSSPVARIERHDVRAEHAATVLRHASRNAAGRRR